MDGLVKLWRGRPDAASAQLRGAGADDEEAVPLRDAAADGPGPGPPACVTPTWAAGPLPAALGNADVSSAARPPLVIVRMSGGGWTNSFSYGVARFLSEMFDVNHAGFRFAGVSGGALVAAALACCRPQSGADIDRVYAENLKTHPLCRYTPHAMCSEIRATVLRLELGDAAFRGATGRLQIGLSAVTRPPNLFRGWALRRSSGGQAAPATAAQAEPWPFAEVSFTAFEGEEHAVDLLRASCHFPMISGVLPFRLGGRGSLLDGFYDGSLSVPADLPLPSVEALAAGAPFATLDVCSYGDPQGPEGAGAGIISPGLKRLPRHWMWRPPPIPVLRTLSDLGYLRAAEFLCRPGEAAARLAPLARPCGAGAGGLDPAKIRRELERVKGSLEAFVATGRWEGERGPHGPGGPDHRHVHGADIALAVAGAV